MAEFRKLQNFLATAFAVLNILQNGFLLDATVIPGRHLTLSNVGYKLFNNAQ